MTLKEHVLINHQLRYILELMVYSLENSAFIEEPLLIMFIELLCFFLKYKVLVIPIYEVAIVLLESLTL